MIRSPSALIALLAAAALIATGCSKGQNTEELLASARAFAEKKEDAAAMIQVKALLQQDPQSGPGRLLLGKLLLNGGDPTAAIVELNKALERAVPEDEVVPEIARAMVQTGQDAKLISQYGATQLKDPTAAADLATSLATAHAMRNDAERAQQLSARALQLKPGFIPAVILQARLKVVGNDAEGALLLLQEVLARDPGNDQAGVLQGNLLLTARKDNDAALAAFRRVLATHPKSVASHLAVIGILRQTNKLDEAKAQFAELKKAAPNHPDTLFLEAQQRFDDTNYAGTREITERLLKAMPDNPRVLLLAGATEYRLRSYVQAEGHLAHALKVAPGLLGARHLLAQTHLRTGQPNKALEVLAPVVDGGKADGGTLALTGEAHLALGDAKRADEAFQRAAKAAPEDPRVRTAVALNQMIKGDSAGAISELESVAAADRGTRADLALITARLRANDLAGALKAVDGLQKKTPDRPLPDLLRGRILLAKKDLPGATAALEAALKKDPKYFPAVATLASIDVNAGKPEEAKKKFQALLERDPSSYQAHVALAELAARGGATPGDVAAGLRNAVKANPTQAAPRIMLVEQLSRSGDLKGALVAAQEGVSALPSDLRLQELLGRVQAANGDFEQAVSTLNKLASQQPKNAGVQILLADAYVGSKDYASAKRALERALEINPGLVAAKRGQASLALQQGKEADAMAIARELQKSQPADPSGFVLEGDIAMRQKNFPAAVAPYRQAFAKAKRNDNAVKLHAALHASGQRPEAAKLAADWLRDNPKDAAFRFYLGDAAIAQRDWAAAEGHYRSVVEIDPRNALALNNVAWLLVQQGKPGAVKLAEQAVSLMPGRAPLLDTLATAQAAENQAGKAVETQKKALAIAPQDPNLRLNLAKHLVKNGAKAEARAELEELARLGDKFPGQREVAQLMEKVR